MRARLYLRLYIALLASAFVCLLVTGVAFRVWSRAGGPPMERMHAAASATVERVPSIHAPDVRTTLSRIAEEFSVDVIVGDQQGPVTGFPGPQAFNVPGHLNPGPHHVRFGAVFVADTDDGGWVAVRFRGPHRHLRMHPFFATLLIMAVVMAVGSYPVARRFARRLEALAEGVNTWGEGQLQHRVAVSGRDEIALLGNTFNQAAERVSVLLSQQKQMLANVSHELRSPLARLRMGLELVAEEADPEKRRDRVSEIHRDIVELDGLIEELLLFARADARVPGRPLLNVDLATLCRDEAARTGAHLELESEPDVATWTLRGDEALLRHLVRNLLENAQQHAGNEDVRIYLGKAGADASALAIRVEDAGPGVPAEEQERIFTPFYRYGATPDDGARAGHGVGLALVRQVARYHGGDVRYEARPTGGSAFVVTLPRTPALVRPPVV